MNIQSVAFTTPEQDQVVINGKHFASYPIRTWHQEIIQEWLDDGNSITPYQISMGALRRETVLALRAEAQRRISEILPALGSSTLLEFFIEIWPMLDQTQASADILLIKDIIIFLRARVQDVAGATRTQLENLDIPSLNWPE